MKNKPPFQITPLILSLSERIARQLGLLAGAKLQAAPVQLRRANKLKTIQSSLAIEGNTLTLEQVSDIFEGKRVIGPPKDIQEVRNAIKVYERMASLNPLSIVDFKKAHHVLMEGLIDGPGKWRTTGVAVFKGEEIAHMAPSAKMVPDLMDQLFDFINTEKDISWIIRACVFHYELEFIHPFIDGNGRMGRLWQQLLLMKEDSVFEFVSVESLIKDHQEQYYDVLAACDKAAESTVFIEFCLENILSALQLYTQSAVSPVHDFRSRLELVRDALRDTWFTRKEYRAFHKNISTATASRDLIEGVKEKILSNKGEKNQVRYRFN
jgi:Fic family protein